MIFKKNLFKPIDCTDVTSNAVLSGVLEARPSEEAIPWQHLCNCVIINIDEQTCRNIENMVRDYMRVNAVRRCYEKGSTFSPDADCLKCGGFGDTREPAL